MTAMALQGGKGAAFSDISVISTKIAGGWDP